MLDILEPKLMNSKKSIRHNEKDIIPASKSFEI
jgi:hypothetical protein